MKIAFLQTSPAFGKIKENVEKVALKLNSTDTSLIVLPELFNTGYQFKSKKELLFLAEDVPRGWTSKTLIEIAKTNGMFIVAGIAEKYNNNFFNSSVLIGPKGFIGKYRKAHLFWNEKIL